MTKLNYDELLDLMIFADMRKEFCAKIFNSIEGTKYWEDEVKRAEYLKKKLLQMMKEQSK